ncbi:hypothetical protein JCM21900_001278 [Sporobolomyces salmonicolor]
MTNYFEEESYQAQSYNEVHYGQKHKHHLTHDAIAGAAAYEASRLSRSLSSLADGDPLTLALSSQGMKMYQEHCAKKGKPQSHQQAKDLLAAFAAAAATNLIETKGLDTLDQYKALRLARQQAERAVDEKGY